MKTKLALFIKQMMFVSGETSEPGPETTTMIEGIVQQQVIEMVFAPFHPTIIERLLAYCIANVYAKLSRATDLAARRGVRSIAIEDLVFLIRHDKAKVSRLRTFLAWKEVRKTARDSDDKPGGADDIPGGAGGDDPFGPGASANPADAAAKGMNKNKRSVKLPWDVSSFYNVQLPERDEDDPDDDDKEMNIVTLQRLKTADERTKTMTRAEYVHYSECRQASFTFRKAKRFKEWAGFGIVTDSKPNDDIVDILGFLTYEIVQTLTEKALNVKAAEDTSMKLSGKVGGYGEEIGRKRKREMGPFDPPEEVRKPVQPKHVQEAFRRLQQPDLRLKRMSHVAKGPMRKQLKLVSLKKLDCVSMFADLTHY